MSNSGLKNENSLAAFVDILGFSAINENRSEEGLYNSFKCVKNLFQEAYSERFDFHQTNEVNFSDCAYLHVNLDCKVGGITPFDLSGDFLSKIAMIQYRSLLIHGIFIRGGIAKGVRNFETITLDSLPREEKTVEFSSAYQDAVTCEKMANYPMVRLADGLYEELMSLHGSQHHGKPYLPVLEIGGIYYVDYLTSVYDDEECDNSRCFCLHKQYLISAYDNVKDKDTIAKKYSWLAHKYHNLIVKKLGISDDLISGEEIPQLDY